MDKSDDFLTRIEDDLQALTVRDDDLAGQEEAIRQERGGLRLRIADLSRLRDGYREYMGMHAITQVESAPMDTPPARGTIADMAYALIQQRGGRMRVADILVELTQLGKLKGSHGEYGTVFRTLARSPRFVKLGPGEFGLAPLSKALASVPPRPS